MHQNPCLMLTRTSPLAASNSLWTTDHTDFTAIPLLLVVSRYTPEASGCRGCPDAVTPAATTGLGDGMSHLCALYYPNGTIVQNSTDVYTTPATLVSGTTYTFSVRPSAKMILSVENGRKPRFRSRTLACCQWENIRLQSLITARPLSKPIASCLKLAMKIKTLFLKW